MKSFPSFGLVGVVRERAHFDRYADAPRDFSGPPERRIEIVGLDHVETAQVLPGFGERAIGGQDLAVGNAYHPRGVGIVQASGKAQAPVDFISASTRCKCCQVCCISSVVGGSRPASSTLCTDNMYRAIARCSFRARVGLAAPRTS